MTEYIGLIITLFLLSMICERLADFFKNYLGETSTGSGRVIGRLLRMGDLTTRNDPDSKEEDRRYYKILKINIWCGFFTALALNADLFNIINHKDEPFKAIGWDGVIMIWDPNFPWEWDLIPQALIFITGCFGTGFFISFGSKFWHDLLDIVYQVKNYRRILADPETYKADNIKSFDKIVSTYESDFIKSAWLEAKSKFMALSNVKVASLKWDAIGYYFELSLKTSDPSITDRYQYRMEDGTLQSVRVKVIVVGNDIARVHSYDLSDPIFSKDEPELYGTLGCLVRPLDGNKSTCILTCSHTFFHPITTIDEFRTGNPLAGTNEKKPVQIGKVIKAIRDHEADASLIEIDANMVSEITNRMRGMGKPGVARTIHKSDEKNVKVYLYGAVSKQQQGFVTSAYSDVKLMYDDNREFQLINVITISNNGAAVSDKGDSGSVVLDKNNDVIGLVVGGNSRETYLLPIETLLLKMNVELI
jgi:hypothetical protein